MRQIVYVIYQAFSERFITSERNDSSIPNHYFDDTLCSAKFYSTKELAARAVERLVAYSKTTFKNLEVKQVAIEMNLSAVEFT